MILGQCGSGKSSILWSLVSEGYTYGKKKKSIFDEGIVYLGTQDAVEAFKKLPIKNHIVLDEFDSDDFTEYLDDLKKHQMERLEKNKHPLNTIIIFDDFCGANLMKRKGTKGSPAGLPQHWLLSSCRQKQYHHLCLSADEPSRGCQNRRRTEW